MNTPPAVLVEGLCYRYDPDEPALEGIDLALPENAYLGIIGQNGSGKTTLIKHLNGLLHPTAGRVEIFGVDTTTVTIGVLARTVGYVFQNPDHGIFCSSTRQEIAFGPRNLGLDGDELQARVDETLAAFGLTPYAAIPPAVLGYGLRRLVSVAAVYAMRPRIFVLDEPTQGLDWRSAQDLMGRIDALHAAGHTIVLVSHDMQLVAEHCQELLVMDGGRALLEGPPAQVFGRASELARASLTPPPVTALAGRLADTGLEQGVLTVRAFAEAYARLLEARRAGAGP